MRRRTRSWLAAGHCFRDHNNVRVERPVADVTTATVGRTDLTTAAGQERTVIAVRQSPTTDVAIAQLSAPITDIEPIRLSPVAPAVGAVVQLTGYGATGSVNPVPETRLRTGRMSVVGITDSITEMTGHSPESSTTPCPYDSGGPFFVPTAKGPALVAVVSNGPSCPHTRVEYAARTDNLRPWIYRSMKPSS